MINQFCVAFAVSLPFGVGNPVVVKKFYLFNSTIAGSMNSYAAKEKMVIQRRRVTCLKSIRNVFNML